MASREEAPSLGFHIQAETQLPAKLGVPLFPLFLCWSGYGQLQPGLCGRDFKQRGSAFD